MTDHNSSDTVYYNKSTRKVVWQKKNLDKIVDVRNEAINADFDQHHKRSADILTNFRIFIGRQKEETL